LLQAAAGHTGFAEFAVVCAQRGGVASNVEAAESDVIEGGGVDAGCGPSRASDSALSTRCTMGTPPRYSQ